MVKVPVWLVQPGVFPVRTKLPVAEPMSEPMVPVIVRVLLTEPPDGFPVIVIVMMLDIIPPVVIWVCICPVMAVLVPKHCDREPVLVKVTLAPDIDMPFCVRPNVKDARGCPEVSVKVSVHVPVALLEGLLFELFPHAAARSVSAIASSRAKYFIVYS